MCSAVQCSDTVPGSVFMSGSVQCGSLLPRPSHLFDFLFFFVLSLTPSCLVMVVSYQRESLIFFVLFFSETPPLSVSHSTARLTHASSCGVAIQTIPSSARPRKGRPSTAPCVGMERYRFHHEQRSGGPFLFLISVFLFFSDLLDIFKGSSFRFPDTNFGSISTSSQNTSSCAFC